MILRAFPFWGNIDSMLKMIPERYWKSLVILASLLIALVFSRSNTMAIPPTVLPSWNEGTAKTEIIQFVNRVTTENSPDYVPPGERIAVFDNDGTLWSEKPFYFQGFFLIDRLKAMVNDHPQWRSEQPYQAILEDDRQAIAQFSEKDLAQLIAVTHSAMTVEEFQTMAIDWLKSAKHPRFDRRFTELVFQPQLELLDYLRANGFKTFIVSGGGIEFVRAFAEEVYGIPPEQVIGSSVKTKFTERDGGSVLVKLPELGSYDDKDGKPVNINLHIGRRPILAFGNSDGDLAMLQYTADNRRSNLILLLHHDDESREWAYDRNSRIVGHLDQAWDEAKRRGWTVVSMKRDFQRVYPFDR
jgi:phosphoserine phosphatase